MQTASHALRTARRPGSKAEDRADRGGLQKINSHQNRFQGYDDERADGSIPARRAVIRCGEGVERVAPWADGRSGRVIGAGQILNSTIREPGEGVTLACNQQLPTRSGTSYSCC